MSLFLSSWRLFYFVLVWTERFRPFPWRMTCLLPTSYSVHCAFRVFYWTWPEIEPFMVFGVVPPFICWKSVVQPWNGKIFVICDTTRFVCNYLYPCVVCGGVHIQGWNEPSDKSLNLCISHHLFPSIFGCLLVTMVVVGAGVLLDASCCRRRRVE